MDFASIIIYLSIYIGLVSTAFFALSHISGRKKQKQLFTDKELPTVSVIIPAYNEEKSVERTLSSILKSDYPKGKLDIIFVDDGSKDNTLKEAKKFQGIHNGIKVTVLHQENKGSASAHNTGIKKSKAEIFFSMDADTFVEPHSLKTMVRLFKDPKVMCVSPSMLVHKPKGILQRVQQAEYLFGLFLRKAFSSLNAISVTPGAFSAYRRSFLDKHGLYDENNITEDLELALRIQYNGYVIENAPEAPAYTLAPKKFIPLMKQRRRWYTGLMKNTWKYRKMFSPKYGDLGLFVMPIAWISILLSVIILIYLAAKTLFDVQADLFFLSQINFDFLSSINLNFYIIERYIFLLFTNPIIISLLFFMGILATYLHYATKKIGKVSGLVITLPLFFIFFALLFGFWWVVSIIYIALNKEVKWR